MKRFREALQDSNLYDIGFRGNPFTFSNRRMGINETKARLDRALACTEWMKLFPHAKLDHIVTSNSDHLLLLLDFTQHPFQYQNKKFRFEPLWFRCNDFQGKVTQFRSEVSAEDKPLEKMLQDCSSKIADWNKKEVGSVSGKLKRLRSDLDAVRSKEITHDTIY